MGNVIQFICNQISKAKKSNLSIHMSHSVADCQDVLIGKQEVIRKIGCGLDKRWKEERKEKIRRGRTDN